MPVYRDYDQAQLDAQYDQRTLVPDLAPYIAKWREATTQARDKLPGARNLSYGPSPRQRIDTFGPQSETRPVLVFLHGGAWRQLSLEESGYMAPVFVEAGALVASADFDLVPDVTLDGQVAQAKAAVDWLIDHVEDHGGDPQNLVLCGHSSGAHLAAMIATAGTAIAGVAMVSGCYDLEPVRLSARNDYLRLDKEGARRNSPINRLSSGLPPAVIAYGNGELDEFKRQGRDFAAAWRHVGGRIDEIERIGRNHFDMTYDIADPTSPLHRQIRALLGLAGD